MIIQKLLDSDISRAKKLWNDNFDDGTKGFCDFAFSICGNDNIYIVKEDEKPVSMLMAVAGWNTTAKKVFIFILPVLTAGIGAGDLCTAL